MYALSGFGITGTSYTPLDNSFQISEALEQTCRLINDKKNILEKAFLALVFNLLHPTI